MSMLGVVHGRAKSDIPELGPKRGAHNLVVDEITFLPPRIWPRRRCSRSRRGLPDRAGTSNIGSAATFGAGQREQWQTPRCERHVRAQLRMIGLRAGHGRRPVFEVQKRDPTKHAQLESLFGNVLIEIILCSNWHLQGRRHDNG